ncbi:MAG: hypothetical protein LKG23_08670 [Nitrospira sp.]|jgi:hypothetical protein|nr:hypothetical protein [Nitrospira sp.]
MTRNILSTVLLISLMSWSALVRAEVSGADSTGGDAPLGSSDKAPARQHSWEGWLNHGVREVTPASSMPPRSPDLGRATAPLTPSIGPGSGLVGPEGGRASDRWRSQRNSAFGEPAGERRTR